MLQVSGITQCTKVTKFSCIRGLRYLLQIYGELEDIESVTMFADYIVPAVLQQLGVLRYSPSLSRVIESNRVITSGSEEEVELRACTIHAVEELRESIHRKTGKQVSSCRRFLFILINIQFQDNPN